MNILSWLTLCVKWILRVNILKRSRVCLRMTDPAMAGVLSAVSLATRLGFGPLVAVLFGFLLIGEVLGPRQLLGCGLILAGMIAAGMKPNMRTVEVEESAG